jgi:DNA-binding response OmpR family regulator
MKNDSLKIKPLVLIIDDEEDILELLEYTLRKNGYDTIGLLQVNKNSFDILDQEEIDLILMDRNLPQMDGIRFIEDIRSKGFNIPVIYISAKDKDEDILEGFDAYADDYITKPFNNRHLLARIRAVLNRSLKKIEFLKVKDILYRSSNKKFYIDDIIVDLTTLETKLLLEFIRNKDILLTREYLLQSVWEDSFNKKLKTVNVAIKRLKNKIDPKGDKKNIKSVRGEGYIFC